ncbi:MAG: enoyl-CoA hydratase/isomerase family protein [Gammaproteobacteria bacterium]|jgi:enoyl-CoA hydratase|nr:enoyl-CoA hydratase/isomerase family protein [Gammaproteobacteria bacterium]MCH2477089.1 enoyl-CoA hydratase/isomerase family protein [Gammaproteobacteria bacterium]
MANILVNKNASLLEIILNRPDDGNALSLELIEELNEILGNYQDDLEIKLVTLTGQGDKFFIAGGDIKELNAVRSDSDIDEMIKLGRKTLDMIRYYPVPVIALINGYTLGGGAELAMACDYRLAVEKASIGFVHSTLNITTAWGGIIDLIYLLGHTKALFTLIEGKIIKAKEAQELGLIDSVFDDVDSAYLSIESIKETFEKCNTGIIRSNKTIINKSKRLFHQNLETTESVEFKKTWGSKEHWDALETLLSELPS